MKFSPLAVEEIPQATLQQKIQFPLGIVGFPAFNTAEIIYRPDELPFMRLVGEGRDKVSFIVVAPIGLVQGYEVEISEADTEALDIKSPEDALILSIVTLHKDSSISKITLNLVGPIVVNRRTLQARQVIISNCQKYSAQYLLFETSST